jgi:hypothetical protein
MTSQLCALIDMCVEYRSHSLGESPDEGCFFGISLRPVHGLLGSRCRRNYRERPTEIMGLCVMRAPAREDKRE